MAIQPEENDFPDGPGWYTAVRNLIYLLEVFDGYWLEDARELNAMLAKLPALPEDRATRNALLIEQNLLSDLVYRLSGIGNRPWGNLSKTQQDQLREILRLAQIEVRKGEVANRNKLDNHARAVQAIKPIVDAMRRGKPPIPAKTTGQPAGGDADRKLPGVAEKKSKKSTQKGAAQTLLVGAFLVWHKYSERSCGNKEPINNNELFRKSTVGSNSSASGFFKKRFGGHDKYAAACRRDFNGTVLPVLIAMAGDYCLEDTYGNAPPQ